MLFSAQMIKPYKQLRSVNVVQVLLLTFMDAEQSCMTSSLV